MARKEGDDLITELRALNLSPRAVVARPGSLSFARYLVPANHACEESACPAVIVLPATPEDAAKVVNFAAKRECGLGIKGGGHGYTCQASAGKDVGKPFILLDMRLFDEVRVVDGGAGVVVGAGVRFSDVLPTLKRDGLAVIHGQCLHVGVAGFTLHGGVHFGALSELNGLGSSSLLSANMVLPNGTLATVHAGSDDLAFALAGAGSSFGLVLSMTLKTHRTHSIRSAISVLSLDLTEVSLAREQLLTYLGAITNDVSLTLFGLDAYFKAGVFQLIFVRPSLSSLLAALHSNSNSSSSSSSSSSSKRLIHFVVEASWVERQSGVEGEGEGEGEFMTLAKLSRLQAPFQASRVPGMTARAWHASRHYSWAVPSYDLVWGRGHRYAGASLTIPRAHETKALDAFLQSFRRHLDSPKCSDCVAVLHRVGPGLRLAAKSSLSTSSVHPSLATAALWFELDCGLFRDLNPIRHIRSAISASKRQSWVQERWKTCSEFVDAAQIALDGANGDDPESSSFHYPNVPNLKAGAFGNKGWMESYYGPHYPRLQGIKAAVDPANLFRHPQSIRGQLDDSGGESIGSVSSSFFSSSTRSCRMAFALAAYSDFLPVLALAGACGLGQLIRHVLKKLFSLFMK